MIKITKTILLLAICFHSIGQNINTTIQRNDVERIINTLAADDMQGRATFTAGSEKATVFIENEFKKIGLQPLKGLKDYRQHFSMSKLIPLSTSVSLNNKVVSADNICTSTGLTSFHWNTSDKIPIAKIQSGQNFRKEYGSLMRNGKDMIIQVDTEFSKDFKFLQERSHKGSFVNPGDNKFSLVFILTNEDINTYVIIHSGKSEQLNLCNIVGVLPGNKKPYEQVIFSGHYDHLGIIKPVSGDSIANGADDDASGTTAVIELAKHFSRLKNNNRSLIFVAFTAEEIGEKGSQYFASTVDPDKVVAMFNIEMIGKESKFGKNAAFITGFERSDFGTILQKNLKGSEFKFYPDPYPAQNLFYRSDNASLAAKGVPAHTISTDQIDKDPFYHTVKDEIGTLDIDNITATIRAIALSCVTIVSGEDTPTRVPKLEK